MSDSSAELSAGAAIAGRVGADSIQRIPIGRIGVWWFLASEIMVFGGLISSFLLLRLGHGGWEAEAAHVHWLIGSFNTLLLLTSSLMMIEALRNAEDGRRERTRLFLGATICLGLLFLGIKAYEYSLEAGEGFVPSAGLFWSFYYLMTALHGLHVLGGVIAISWLLVMAMRGSLWPEHQQRVEFIGLYWHFVDIVWIFLFPLLYLS